MKFSFGEVAAAIVVVFGPSAIRANDQLSAGSSSSTGIPCANDTVGWVDVAGDGCDWYELYDLPGCPHHGNLHNGGSGVANDHCCFCAGPGVSAISRIGLESFRYSFEDSFSRLAISHHSPQPTYSPTVTRNPTDPPVPFPTPSPTVTGAPSLSARPSVCTGNTVGWVDVAGDGCDWYEVNDLPGCPHHGNSHDGGSGVANDHCCFCAGTGVSATTRIGLNSFRYSFEDFFLVSRYLTILPSLPTVPRSPEIRPTLRCLSRPPVPRSLEPRR